MTITDIEKQFNYKFTYFGTHNVVVRPATEVLDFIHQIYSQAKAEQKTVYQCSCCGFRSDGVLSIHDCDWTNSLKIKHYFNKEKFDS